MTGKCDYRIERISEGRYKIGEKVVFIRVSSFATRIASKYFINEIVIKCLFKYLVIITTFKTVWLGLHAA